MNYLDASAVMPMLVKEGSTHDAIAFRRRNADTLIVSDFAAGEVASSIARRTRMGDLAAPIAADIWDRFDLWRSTELHAVSCEASDIRRATEHVRQHELKLRLPDAIHIAICRRLALTLVTLDARLARAAEALNVSVRDYAEA